MVKSNSGDSHISAIQCPCFKLLSHIDALADAQGTNMVVRHTAKCVGCKFISRSLIGTIRSCAFMCVKGRKKF